MKLRIKEGRNPKNGKPLTIISEIRHNPEVIENLASDLKSKCGTGGHTEGKKIILHGSHIKKAVDVLTKQGYEIATA
ncbi:MAG: translation initiation factor [Balneolaceae bacterium]